MEAEVHGGRGRRPGRAAAAGVIGAAGILLAPAVAPAVAAPAPAAAPAPSGPGVLSAGPAALSARLGLHPARDRADRVLAILDSDAPVDPVETVAMANPAMTAALYPQTLAGALEQWQASGPFTVTGTDDDGGRAVTHLVTARGVPATLTVSVGPVGLIDAITMLPDVPDVHDLAEVEARTEAVGARVSLLAAHADLSAPPGAAPACTPDYAAGADAVLPMGSVFKLYVLGALGQAVRDGAIGWDDTLTITDDVRSLPTGELQNRPDGSTVTVREAADKMIAISDNTATDLLIRALGRDRVEDAVRAMGDRHPGGLIPLPTTREFFIIGWGPDASLRERWRAAAASAHPEAERRAVLAEADTRSLDGVDMTALMDTPRAPGGIGWYASAADICRAHVALQRQATGAAAPIREILAQNPGVPVDAGYVAFKGGSAPGRLAGSWLVAGSDASDASVLVFQMVSGEPIGVIEQNYVFGLMQQALAMRG